MFLLALFPRSKNTLNALIIFKRNASVSVIGDSLNIAGGF